MTIAVDPNIQIESASQLFNWQNSWYPVTFKQDFIEEKPYSFSLYDQSLVLFRNQQQQLVCLKNLCPHRAAKLSDGQIIDGKIECLYHGWQFGTDGECLHIPQLQQSAQIPKQACIQSFPVVESQEIIWVWLGDAKIGSPDLIPQVSILEKPELFVVDTVADLPYDQDFLVENFLDPAHVPISHDGTELNMTRDLAAPLTMEILSSSETGFVGRYRKSGAIQSPWTQVKFHAPYLVEYQFGSENSPVFGGFALYGIPLGQGRCRVLVRRYGTFFNKLFRLKPRWLEHLRQNKILEEDLSFIVEQQLYVQKTGQSLKETYLPLKSLDTFVIEHRKWLDQFGQNLPYYQGYVTSKQNHNHSLETIPLTRLARHTQICSSCYRAYQTIKLLKQIFMAAAIALAGCAIVTENKTIQILLVCLSILAMGKFALLQKLKTHFEQ